MDDTQSGNTDLKRRGMHVPLAPLDHDEYDALADLFLGDGELAPGAIGGDAVAVKASDDHTPPSHDTHTPVLHLTHCDDDAPLDETRADVSDDPFRPEAAGMRVLESLRATDDHAAQLLAELMDEHVQREKNDADAHEEADKWGDEGVGSETLPGPEVEVVVLGHLPVRASLWARQYACSCARERGEVVALIRAASGTTAVDLITGEAPMQVSGSGDLDAALGSVHEIADRVIMRVDEASEPELLDRPEVGTITILTGADEAAVVASYRLVKTLDASLGELFDFGAGPMLRIAVMGAGREQALDAKAKLRSAVETFISRPVEIVIGAGRIDATGTTNIYRDTMAHPASHILGGLVRAAELEQAGSCREEPGRDGLDAAAVVQTTIKDASMIEPKAVVGREKKAAPAVSERESARVDDGLCALIPGLRAIETRCPASPGVELAVDDRGRLHLLACDADTREALARLYGAQSWARDHLALLLRAEPGLTIPSADRGVESEAMMHLITPEPSAVRELYDTPVRVYALARVKMGRVVAQVATALN